MSAIYNSGYNYYNNIINRINGFENTTTNNFDKISSDVISIKNDTIYNPYNASFNPLYKIPLDVNLPNSPTNVDKSNIKVSTKRNANINELITFDKINELPQISGTFSSITETMLDIYIYIPRPYILNNVISTNSENIRFPYINIEYNEELNCAIYKGKVFTDFTKRTIDDSFNLDYQFIISYAATEHEYQNLIKSENFSYRGTNEYKLGNMDIIGGSSFLHNYNNIDIKYVASQIDYYNQIPVRMEMDYAIGMYSADILIQTNKNIILNTRDHYSLDTESNGIIVTKLLYYYGDYAYYSGKYFDTIEISSDVNILNLDCTLSCIIFKS